MKKLINILVVLLLPVMGMAVPSHVNMVSSHHKDIMKSKKHHRKLSFSLNRFSVDLALGGVPSMGNLNNGSTSKAGDQSIKVKNAFLAGLKCWLLF